LDQSAKEPEEESDDDDEGEEGEPEDDFNAAWEVFELARGIYEKENDGDDQTKLKLADIYIALGDVSLETGAAPLLRRYRIVDTYLQRSLTRQ
jgi:HAT1-interacting factor 1